MQLQLFSNAVVSLAALQLRLGPPFWCLGRCQAVDVNQVAALKQKTCRDTLPLHARLLMQARLRKHALLA
jgi:hypothetical protein